MVNKNSKQIKSDIINKSLKTLGNTTKNNKEKKMENRLFGKKIS